MSTLLLRSEILVVAKAGARRGGDKGDSCPRAPKDYDVVEFDSYTIDNTPHLASNSSKDKKI